MHGTFMTRSLWRLRTVTGRELMITTEAMKPGEASVLTLPDAALTLEPSELAKIETMTMKPWQRMAFDDVHIETRMLSVNVATPAWNVTVTSKQIYGLVKPLLNETHVHGKWEEEQRRLDLLLHGAFPQPDAHGIVGQSYQDGTVRHGKLDAYAADSPADLANNSTSERALWLAPMTTSAQAEGAIEGVYTDYKLANVFSTRFKFSRYDRVAMKAPAAKRTASTSEWDGAAAMKAGRKKEL